MFKIPSLSSNGIVSYPTGKGIQLSPPEPPSPITMNGYYTFRGYEDGVSNDMFEIYTETNLAFNTMSFVFWYNSNGNSCLGSYEQIASLNGDAFYIERQRDDNFIHVGTQYYGGKCGTSSVEFPDDDLWHSIIITWDDLNGVLKIYLDGELDTGMTSNMVADTNTAINPLLIMKSVNLVDKSLSKYSIYSEILSDEDATNFHDQNYESILKTVAIQYNMDEDVPAGAPPYTGYTIDSSIYHNHATPNVAEIHKSDFFHPGT